MGRIKEYMMWHDDKYGAPPQDMSRIDEFMEDSKREHEEWFGIIETKAVLPQIIIYSPSVKLISDIQNEKLCLHDLDWKQFEDIVAELLSKDGFTVTPGKRTKDGGVDIFAEKHIDDIGKILTVWQAKKLLQKNKVGISTIRELADTRTQHKASKGIIVTNTGLTKGAIDRISTDTYLLDKVDGIDLVSWIQRISI